MINSIVSPRCGVGLHTPRFVGKNLSSKPVERKKIRPDLFSKNLFSRPNLL